MKVCGVCKHDEIDCPTVQITIGYEECGQLIFGNRDQVDELSLAVPLPDLSAGGDLLIESSPTKDGSLPCPSAGGDLWFESLIQN